MSRFRWTLVGLAGLLVGVLIGLAPAREAEPLAAVTGNAAAIPPTSTAPPVPDPFPIRRVYGNGERLKLALAEESKGTLVRLPREAFEARVRAATTTSTALPPRITEATYLATLDRGGLQGTATWQIAGSGVLPLEPLNTALSPGLWSDGRPVVIFQSDAMSLLVDRPGDNAVSFPWSSRATEEPAGDRFELAFPPAAIASLVLTIPSDRTPVVSTTDALVTGPFPGPTADRKLWRLAFGGRSKFELVIRQTARGKEPPPVANVERNLRYELSPGQVILTADFNLESTRTPTNDFAFEIDPSLRVTDVSGINRVSWKVEPKQRPEDPNRLRVLGQDPGAVSRVTITAVAPFQPVAAGWPCPLIRVVDGIPRNDAIEVRVDPEFSFIGLDPGDFRVVGGATDRSYRINLVGSLSAQSDRRVDRRPPTLRVRPAEAEYASSDEITWTLSPGSSQVTARFKVRVNRGPLVQIPLQVTGLQGIESITSIPDDPGLTWPALPGSPGGILIEPSRPLSAGQSLELILRFRGPTIPRGDELTTSQKPVLIPFPRLVLAGANEREGTYHVVARPGLRVWPTIPPPVPGSLTYSFRGRSPDVGLAILPSTDRATVDRDTAVSVEDDRLFATTTLQVQSPDEALKDFMIFTPISPGVKWDVRGPMSASIRRTPWMPWLGPGLIGSGWSALANSAVSQSVQGDLWIVRLSRASSDVTITTVAERPVLDSSRLFPLPSVLGARLVTSEYSLSPKGEVRFEPPIHELGFPDRFRLVLRGTAARQSTDRSWKFERMALAIHVEDDGRLSCILTGRLQSAAASVLPIVLPDSATFHGALVAGRIADVVAVGSRVELPILQQEPTDEEFEVRYSLPGASGTTSWIRPPIVQFDPPLPTLPSSPPIDDVRWTSADTFRRWPRLEAAEQSATPSPMTTVRTNALRATGYGISALLAGLAIGLIGRIGRRGLIPVGLTVAILGVADLQSPNGWSLLIRPTLTVAFLAFTALAIFIGPRAIVTSSSSARNKLPSTVSQGRVGLGLVVGLSLLSSAQAQAPEPATVYVVSGPAAAPGRLSVLAPPALLERLDATAQIPTPPVMIVSADYEGTAEAEGLATIVARYQVIATKTGDKTLSLPLSGIRLEELQIDSQPAFPEAPKPDRYAVKLPGPGKHDVVVRFVVATTPLGGDREVRFGCPDVPCSHVRFTAPMGSRQLDVSTRRGIQKVSGARARADANHGSGTSIAIRWRSEQVETKPTITLREVVLWELTDVGEYGTAVFAFRVTGGSVTRLNVELPDTYEPSKPVIRTGPGLRDWRLNPTNDGFQTLSIGFQTPVEGRVVVVVRLNPKRPGLLRPVLRFPRPTRDVSSEGFVAVRTKGVAIEDLPRPVELIDYAADLMIREFGVLSPELGFDRFPPERVFQRAPNSTPELRPALRQAIEEPLATAEVVWTLGMRADVEGTVKVVRPAVSILFEFDLPSSVQVRDIRSPDMYTWVRTGNRIQVWFRKATRDATIRWTGSLNGYPSGGTAAAGVDLPLPRGPSINGPVTVKVHAVEGWSVAVPPVRGLSIQPPGDRPEDQTMVVEPPAAVVRATAFLPVPPASATLGENFDGSRYLAVMQVPVRPNRPSTFTLRVTGLPLNTEPTLKFNSGARIGVLHQSTTDAQWTVSVPASASSTIVLTLTCKVSRIGRLPEPELSFHGPPIPWSERRLEATGVTVSDGPAHWHSTGPNRWSAEGPGGAWMLAAIAPAPPEQPTASSPKDFTDATNRGASPFSMEVVDQSLTVVWLIGYLAVLTLCVVGRAEWWPERLVGCGMLAGVALGWNSFSGMVFLVLAAAGLLCRVAQLSFRLGRLILR